VTDFGQTQGKEKTKKMRNYEVAFIVHPEVDEHGVSELTDKVQGWITSGGGSVEKVDRWGKKRFAYIIRKQREGHYVLIEAKMGATTPIEVERNLRLTEQVLRFMILKADPPAPAPVVAVTEETPAPAATN
jgi:small subunit ribosomal protein S6